MNVISIGLYVFACILLLFLLIKRVIDKTYISPITYVIFIQLLLPFIFIYPFSYSENNIDSVGNWFYRYLDFISQTLLISSLGTIVFIFSFLFFSRKNKNKNKKSMFMNSMDGISNPSFLYSIILFVAFIILFLNGFSLTTNAVGVRNVISSNPILSPVYNFVSSLIPLIIGILILRCWKHKHLLDFLFLILIFYFSFLTGSRTTLLSGIVFFLIAYFSTIQYKYMNLIKMSITGLVIMTIFLSLSLVRSGSVAEEGIRIFDIIDTFLYGNTFSDFRDTAWVLAGMDSALLYGKTYLSAILSFIPSSVASFREIWSLGFITTNVTNLDSTTHPGLRPVIFGEAFFNFGYIGVILIAIIYGAVISSIDKVFLNNLKSKNEKHKKAYISFVLIFITELVSNIMITAGFFYVYVILITLLAGKIYSTFNRRVIKNENYNY